MSKPAVQYENWPQWFRVMWPNAEKRWIVIHAYRAFAQQQKAMFVDIALRNNVFAPIRERDPHLAAIAEGRRQCALEIIKLGNLSPEELYAQTQIDRTRNNGERP